MGRMSFEDRKRGPPSDQHVRHPAFCPPRPAGKDKAKSRGKEEEEEEDGDDASVTHCD